MHSLLLCSNSGAVLHITVTVDVSFLPLFLLLRMLPTLIARLKARCRAMDCSAGMRLKKAGRCWVINGDVLMVFSRWMRDAVCIWHWRADAITANTLDTQSGFCSSWASSSASGKPLAYTATSTFIFIHTVLEGYSTTVGATSWYSLLVYSEVVMTRYQDFNLDTISIFCK